MFSVHHIKLTSEKKVFIYLIKISEFEQNKKNQYMGTLSKYWFENIHDTQTMIHIMKFGWENVQNMHSLNLICVLVSYFTSILKLTGSFNWQKSHFCCGSWSVLSRIASKTLYWECFWDITALLYDTAVLGVSLSLKFYNSSFKSNKQRLLRAQDIVTS